MTTPNTVLADINEIYVGYVLNNKKWYSSDAKTQYNLRIKQATPKEVENAIGKAIVMAKEFVKWAKANGYSSKINNVWWTARPNSMTNAVGVFVDQSKNPTDVLAQFSSGPSNGFLGLSAKATKTKGDIGFKNPGIGTVDKSLNIHINDSLKKLTEEVIKKYDLPKSASERKKYIRSNEGLKSVIETIAIEFMNTARDEFIKRLMSMSQDELKQYLLEYWMDADILYPPYIKVTGMGNKPPYTAVVMDPLNNPKLKALRTYDVILEKVGNESVGVKAGGKKIMKMRFKFESQKLASSLKMSGDPW